MLKKFNYHHVFHNHAPRLLYRASSRYVYHPLLSIISSFSSIARFSTNCQQVESYKTIIFTDTIPAEIITYHSAFDALRLRTLVRSRPTEADWCDAICIWRRSDVSRPCSGRSWLFARLTDMHAYQYFETVKLRVAKLTGHGLRQADLSGRLKSKEWKTMHTPFDHVEYTNASRSENSLKNSNACLLLQNENFLKPNNYFLHKWFVILSDKCYWQMRAKSVNSQQWNCINYHF